MSAALIYSPVRRDDDLAAYRANDTPEEQQEARLASLAHDIVYLRARAIRENGPRVSVTIAVPWYDFGPHGLERLNRYLSELGQRVQATEQVLDTGRYVHIAPIKRRMAATA